MIITIIALYSMIIIINDLYSMIIISNALYSLIIIILYIVHSRWTQPTLIPHEFLKIQ